MNFINCSNHPSEYWCKNQRDAAAQFGEIADVPFSVVDTAASEKEIGLIADEKIEGSKSFQHVVIEKR